MCPRYRVIAYLALAFAGSCFATILPVPDDYSTIQDACDASAEGDTVLIAPGEYSGGILVTNHGLVLASHFILDQDTSFVSSTIINGENNESIIYIDPTSPAVVIILGLTLTGSEIPEDLGGTAVWALATDVEIRNCRIMNNEGLSAAIRFNGGNLTLENSIFIHNVGHIQGGALGVYESDLYITSNHFESNSCIGGYAGVISAVSCSGDIVNNTFTDNYADAGGGAMDLGSPSEEITNIKVSNNRFYGNLSHFGGAFTTFAVDTLEVSNNIFRNNVAWIHDEGMPYGGAAHIGPESADVDIFGNEFYYNIAYKKGGALVLSSGADVYDNLFFRNQANIIYNIYSLMSNGFTFQAHLYNNLFFQNTRLDLDTPWDDYGSVNTSQNTTMTYYENDFYGNDPYAAGVSSNPIYRGNLNIEHNYWGHPSGPYHETQNPGGMGDSVMVELDVLPFSTAPHTTRWLREPEPLDLMLPEAGVFIDEDTIQFLWHAAPDSTPHDTLRYTLEIADNPEFTDALLIDTDLDTFATVPEFEWESAYYWRVLATDIYDLETYSNETRQFLVTSVDEHDSDGLPTEWSIESIYPNPFNSAVQVVIGVPTRDDVRITIYDLQGRLVDTIQHGSLSAGHQRFVWWPHGAAGMYFVRVSSGSWEEIRKVVYVK